jgi:long-chain fatty acid transport protein
MGGAAVAAPLDAAGSIYWNPAATSGLPKSEMLFSTAIAYGDNRLFSTIPANSFGPGIPPATPSGETRSDGGFGMLPNFALVYVPENSPWTFGIGAFAAGGFFNNFPANPGNPIVSPRPPNGFGNGLLFTSAAFGEFIGSVAVKLTNRLSFGMGPIVAVSSIQAVPGSFAPPDDANHDGLPTYPPAIGSRPHWGLGFTAGLYYAMEKWRFGAAFKSPVWFEKFEFASQDELGFPRTLNLHVDFPLIASIGASYVGIDKWLWAVDVRYVDFKDTAGLGNAAGFDATGAITGVGWHSVLVVATGVQYQWTDALSLRMGYMYNQEPTPGQAATFNTAGAAIYQHIFTVGASYQLTSTLKLSAAYGHAFHHAITGPFETPAGPIPFSSVRIVQSAEAFHLALSVNY